MAGIDTAPKSPGFRRIVIRPRLDDRISQARGEYSSVYGHIASEWKGTRQGPFSLRLTIPANTTAEVWLPAIPNARVSEGGKPVKARAEGDHLVAEAGSGSYHFQVR